MPTTIKNYVLVGTVSFALIAILLLIAYPKQWLLDIVGKVFADQAIVALFAMICAALAVSLLINPILAYLQTAQRRRIEVIKGFFSEPLIIEYFRQYWMGRDGIPQLVREADQGGYATDKIRKSFDELMQSDFGIGQYRFPLAVLLAVASIVMFFAFTGGFSFAAKLAGHPEILRPPLGIPVDLVSIAAIFGAYIWVTSDAIQRNHHGAIHASDLSWYALRLVIAVPLGQAISLAAGTELQDGQLGTQWAAFFAFVISMFSLERINQILGSIANRAFKSELVSNPAEREDLVIRLPGIDERTSNLLAAEGITTIAHVVASDPVRLSIRTALPFAYVLGLIDAGMLWTYVGNQLTTFRQFGLKGATNVLARRDGVAAAERLDAILAHRAEARAALTAASDRAGTTQASLVAAARRLAAAEDQKREADAAGRQLTQAQSDELQAAQGDQAAAEAVATGAAAELERARDALGRADAELSAALTDDQAFLEALAGKAQMEKSGIALIFMQIETDAYARFIRRLSSVA